MTKALATEHRLLTTVTALRERYNDLVNSQSREGEQLVNSFGGLIGTLYPENNLTSIEPIFQNNVYTPVSLNYNMLTYWYKSDGILQSLIDGPVDDALRGGLDFESKDLDEDDIDEWNEDLDRMGFYAVSKSTEIWGRLYGGGGLIVYVQGENPAKPLDMKRLQGKVIKFYPAYRWELISPTRTSETYNFYGETIHSSRVITVAGKEPPGIIKWMLQGWGMSECESLIQPINIYKRNQNAVYDLLKEAKVDVYQFERFNATLATQKGMQQLVNRIQLMNRAKSNSNAVLLDSKDTFTQKQMTFSGLAAIWQENRINLCATVRMPVTKLFGTSAAGFNSGEDDIENYNGMIESDIRDHMRPMLRQAIDILMIAKYGSVLDVKFKFKSLRVLTSEAEELIKTSKHNRYRQDYLDGLIDAKEYAALLHKEGLMPIKTKVQTTGKLPTPPLTQDDMDKGGEKKSREDSKNGKQRQAPAVRE